MCVEYEMIMKSNNTNNNDNDNNKSNSIRIATNKNPLRLTTGAGTVVGTDLADLDWTGLDWSAMHA